MDTKQPSCRIGGCPRGPEQHPVHDIHDLEWVNDTDLRIGNTVFSGVTLWPTGEALVDDSDGVIVRSEPFTFVARNPNVTEH